MFKIQFFVQFCLVLSSVASVKPSRKENSNFLIFENVRVAMTLMAHLFMQKHVHQQFPFEKKETL